MSVATRATFSLFKTMTQPSDQQRWLQLLASGSNYAQDLIFEIKQLDELEYDRRDELEENLKERPLSVDVRNPDEFQILLSTGGPAMRIIGDLDKYCQPTNAKIQVQDWFKPWTTCDTNEEQDKALLAYAHLFYYGV